MTDQAMSPLRRRMIEDMTIRKLAPKTQHDYVQRVKDFAAFLGRSPATASKEDVRRYQLHVSSNGARTPKINGTVSVITQLRAGWRRPTRSRASLPAAGGAAARGRHSGPARGWRVEVGGLTPFR